MPTNNYKEDKLSERWGTLDGKRSSVLKRAEESAKLTIPSVFPIAGFSEESSLDEVYQSLGARAVLNLSSKFLQNMFPATGTFFKLMLSKDLEERVLSGSEPSALDKINSELVKLETATMNHLERLGIRNPIHEALKLLIVTGNALLWKDGDSFSIFNLRDYVVLRDSSGNILEIIVREKVDVNTLPEDIRPKDTKNSDEVVVYSRLLRTDEGYVFYQSIDDVFLASTEQNYKVDDVLPFIALRWTEMPSSNYGRGLVEHYIGDLRNYEALNMAIVDFASVMSRIIFLVNPNTQHGTNVKDLNEAVTGDFIAGHADDITTPDLGGKTSDLRALLEYMGTLETRLSQAFLLFTSRNAERVTAEEIRVVAQQLEETLGGVYSLLARDLQKPLLALIMKDLKIKLETGIEPVITTGISALGRGNDALKLSRFMEFLSMSPESAQYVNKKTLIERATYSLGISPDGLIYTDEEIQAQQQQAQNAQLEATLGQSLAQNGGAGLVNAMTPK